MGRRQPQLRVVGARAPNYLFAQNDARLRNVDDRLDRLSVPQACRTSIETWLGLLREWNARIDLTAARTDDELYDLMLADAVLLADRENIAEGARVVDVGTGAGAPGLAVALLRPDLKVTLIEPLTKRIAFLRTVLGTLGRTDVVLLRDRGDVVAKKEGRAWDVALSRATLPPETWLPLGLSLAPKTWVLLAKESPPAGEVLVKEHVYVWPLTQASRRAVLYQRP